MALNMQKTVPQLRYDNTWTGKHKTQCYFKHSKMADEVDSLVEFMKNIFRSTSCVFLYGSNDSDSVAVGNATFGEIKDHSFRRTPFQKKKKIAMKF